MVKRVDISEFTALVERCEGTDRRKQENYLVRVLKSFVAEHAKRDMKLSDENVLEVLGVTNMECIHVIVNTIGDIYSVVSKALLDNPDYRLDVVRTNIVEHMRTPEDQDGNN